MTNLIEVLRNVYFKNYMMKALHYIVTLKFYLKKSCTTCLVSEIYIIELIYNKIHSNFCKFIKSDS